MTKPTHHTEHPSDAFAARLASFTDRFVGLARRRALLDAEEARLLAEAAAYADATSAAIMPESLTQAEGQALARRSLCASLAMATLTSEPTLQRRISDAEALVHTAPAALDALGSGSLSAAHTRIITDQLREVPVEARQSFLERVLPVAEHSTPARLKQRARALRERLHPESIVERAARSAADRRLEFEPAADGMAWLHLYTTSSVAQGIFERTEAIASTARATGDDRTLAQLRADALSSLAVRGVVTLDDTAAHDNTALAPDHSAADDDSDEHGSASAGGSIVWLPGSKLTVHTARRVRASTSTRWPVPSTLERPLEVEASIRATVQITVPVLSLLGATDEPATLDGYGPIDPETAARLTITAPSMTRILTHPETGAVLSVGREQYRVPADLQRAVRLRDGTCRAPGCGRRARACDLDHSTAWADGGATAVGNLASLCRHHHRLKHLPQWNLAHPTPGVLDWRTPDGREYRTEPELTATGWPPASFE